MKSGASKHYTILMLQRGRSAGDKTAGNIIDNRVILFWAVLCLVPPYVAAQSPAASSETTEWSDYGTSFPLEAYSGVKAHNGDFGDNEAADPGFDDRDWQRLSVPSNVRQTMPDWGPVIWYRIAVTFPKGEPPPFIVIGLGEIADFDHVWFNGTLIGVNAAYVGNPSAELYRLGRWYRVPGNLIKPGETNMIAVRVEYGSSGRGGIIGGDLSLSRSDLKMTALHLDALFRLLLIMFSLFSALGITVLYLHTRERVEHLFFAGLITVMSVYFLCLIDDPTIWYMNYPFWRRVQYISLWLGFPTALFFFVTFFRRRFSVVHLIYGTATSFAAIGLGIFTSDTATLNWVNLNIMQFTWIYPLGYGAYHMVKNYKKSKEVRVMVFASLLFFALVILDIIKSREEFDLLRSVPYLSTYGAPVLVGGYAFFIFGRQVNIYHERTTLYRMATTDSLTGVTVRGHFMDRLRLSLAAEAKRGGMLALIMLDLDRFKLVNDTYGHPAGDLVLRETAKVLQGELRDRDYIGRYGGEEFFICLPGTEIQAALAVAERLRTLLEDHKTHLPGQEVDITVTASFGVVSYTLAQGASPPDSDMLIAEADKALYRAKAEGRNRVAALDRAATR